MEPACVRLSDGANADQFGVLFSRLISVGTQRSSQRQMEGSASCKHFVVGRVLSGPTARGYDLQAPASVMPAERWKFPHKALGWKFPRARRLDLETRTSVIPSVCRGTGQHRTKRSNKRTGKERKQEYPRPDTKQTRNHSNPPRRRTTPPIQSHDQTNKQTTAPGSTEAVRSTCMYTVPESTQQHDDNTLPMLFDRSSK